MRSIGSSIPRTLRRAWAYFFESVEWMSNGNRLRRKNSERSDLWDPTAGWTAPDPAVTEALDSERTGRRDPDA